MNTQIKIDKIEIFSKGDEKVGIFPSTWTVEQEIYIYENDLEIFRENIKAAWEYVADNATIYFTINGKSERYSL